MLCKFPVTLSPLSPHLSNFLYWPVWQLIPLTRSFILSLFFHVFIGPLMFGELSV